MKQIVSIILIAAVLLIGVGGSLAAAPPAMVHHETNSTLPTEQPDHTLPTIAMPTWGWLIILPAAGIFLLLSVTPLVWTTQWDESTNL